MNTIQSKLRACLFAALFAVSAGFGTAASALENDAMVLQWNLIAVQAVGTTPPFPVDASDGDGAARGVRGGERDHPPL